MTDRSPNPICYVDVPTPCGRKVLAKGLCGKHYQWAKAHPADAGWRNRVMGDVPECSVVDPYDCHLPVHGNGLCSRHFQWSRNHPSEPYPMPGTPKGAAIAYYLANIGRVDNECWPWPFAKDDDGYGICGHLPGRRRNVGVHSLACEDRHGPPPPGQQAAHGAECVASGVGRACWNPAHLSWKTAAGQAADRRRDGTHFRGESHPVARLTERAVIDILNLYWIEHIPQREIATRYGVIPQTISMICTRRIWRHIVWPNTQHVVR